MDLHDRVMEIMKGRIMLGGDTETKNPKKEKKVPPSRTVPNSAPRKNKPPSTTKLAKQKIRGVPPEIPMSMLEQHLKNAVKAELSRTHRLAPPSTTKPPPSSRPPSTTKPPELSMKMLEQQLKDAVKAELAVQQPKDDLLIVPAVQGSGIHLLELPLTSNEAKYLHVMLKDVLPDYTGTHFTMPRDEVKQRILFEGVKSIFEDSYEEFLRNHRKKGGGKKGGSKKNAWVTYVKKYARQHGLSYNDALKKAGPSYRREQRQKK